MHWQINKCNSDHTRNVRHLQGNYWFWLLAMVQGSLKCLLSHKMSWIAAERSTSTWYTSLFSSYLPPWEQVLLTNFLFLFMSISDYEILLKLIHDSVNRLLARALYLKLSFKQRKKFPNLIFSCIGICMFLHGFNAKNLKIKQLNDIKMKE